MSSTLFDPASFLDAGTTEALEKRPPLPAGEYTAIIEDLTAKQWSLKDGSKSGMKFDVALSVEVPYDIQQELGIDKAQIKLTDGIMLDLTPNGGIDYSKGKNNGLRRYREATGQNVPGESFTPRNLIGRPIRVRIAHEVYQDSLVERVTGVSKLGG